MTPVRVLALHLATALELHGRNLRANGVALPVELDQAARWAWDVARSDSARQEPTSLVEWVDLVHARRVNALLLTAGEVAEALSLSERQVERLIAAGTLPSVLVGTARRVRADDLAAYVDSLGPRPFRDRIESKVAPVSPSHGPADRRVTVAGAPGGDPAGYPVPRGAA